MTEIKMPTYNVEKVRDRFPIMKQVINGKPLIYLDSAATSQKPQSVIDAIVQYYSESNANVHRGIYTLSNQATAKYEAARQAIKNFIKAKHNHEIIFTRSTTEAINLVAYSYGALNVKAGDEIIISGMEHHSNIVPWQILCEQQGATLKIIPVLPDGSLDIEKYESLFTHKTKMVAFIHISNVLGTVNPVKSMIQTAHKHGVPVLVDGAQAVPHMSVDMQDLDCDFYTFSGHKMYGPTGIGVLYAKTKYLEKMRPYQSGGDMISRVTFESTQYNVLPHKFEAGTPNMAGVIGLGESLLFLEDIQMDLLAHHEDELLHYATERLKEVHGLRIIGQAKDKLGVISFVMQSAHPHDIATILDQDGIAIRAGHHCAMPLMDRFDVPATARISFGAYTDQQEIDYLIESLHKVNTLFK